MMMMMMMIMMMMMNHIKKIVNDYKNNKMYYKNIKEELNKINERIDFYEKK